jgi:hypothetical protein
MSLRTSAECAHVFGSTSSGTIALVSAVATKRVYVYRLVITLATPGVTVTLQDTANAALSQPFQLAANGSITLDTPINFDPWWQSGTGLGVQLAQGGSTVIGFDVWYIQAP